jgi:uncharacterized protein (DUF488 family)
MLTIGHSNRSWNEFLGLLKKNNVNTLVDVRRYPVSKTWQHYNKNAMEVELEKQGIHYIHIEALGGRRKPDGSEDNSAWENDQFRGYADHTKTKEFKEAVDQLLKMEGNIALMCAEATPWTCHRKILADYLTAKGHEIYDITSAAAPKLHKLPEFAKVRNGELTYPSIQQTLK